MLSAAEAIAQFQTAISARGLKPVIVADGQLHRCSVEGDKKGKKSGAYVLYCDGVPAGGFQNFRDGLGWENWRADLKRELTAPEEAEYRRRMDAARKAREAEQATRRREAKAEAARLWKAAEKASPQHPYLARKRVRTHGIRQLRDMLLVPVRDFAGETHGLERIWPNGDKRFITGTAVTGNFYLIGQPSPDGILAIAEGFATAATVAEATSWPVAVAFSSGNLEAVARALQGGYPQAQIFVAADDDRATPGNPGRSAANSAAAAVGGRVIAPTFSSGEGTDWNDWALEHGPEATKAALLAGAASAPAIADPANFDAPNEVHKGLNGSAAHVGSHFELDKRGLWWHGVDKHGEPQQPSWIGPPIRVVAHLRDEEDDNWGRLVEFEDPKGNCKQWGLPARILVKQDEVIAELMRQGYALQPRRFNRERVVDYLGDRHKVPFARSTERTGWHGHVYVRPEGTFGTSDEAVFFQSETLSSRIYQQSGTLDDWRANVSDLCRGNSRLLFVVSAAFAGILVRWADEPSGGFHLRGDSSIGKTTALRVAASVFGGTDYIRTWRATDNALESVAAQHSDTLLVLDELAQVDSRLVGETIYMLGNESGKSRAHRSGGLRTVHRWRLLFLSSGEDSLAELMRQAGKRAKPGQETRFADVPGDAGAGKGMFENLRGAADGAAFARELLQGAATYHGTAAPAFIEGVIPRLAELPALLQQRRREFAARVTPKAADGQVIRVASRFALVAVAGELATDLGITGWDKGEASAAIETVFRAWLMQRGGVGRLEPELMLAAVRDFIEAHGEAAFTPWDGSHSAGDSKWITRDRAGFRRTEGYGAAERTFYYVLAEAFRTRICSGFDHNAIAALLEERGILKRGEGRNRMKKVPLPGLGKPRVYVLDGRELFVERGADGQPLPETAEDLEEHIASLPI